MSIFRLIPDKSNVTQVYNQPDNKNSFRYKLFEIIFQAHTPAGKLFDICLFLLILTNIVCIMLESIPAIGAKHYILFRFIDYAFSIIFTIEYILRIICVKSPKNYIFSFYGIVDLMAVLPVYLEFVFPQSHMLMLIRSFRLLRVFRIFNMVNFLEESRMLLFAILRSSRKIVVFLFFVVLLTTFLGAAMYVIEYQHNSGFTSIPQSIYWAIVTITTVGYGDIAPVTPIGKIFASFIMILGYAIIAVPTGIITSDFARGIALRKKQLKVTCHNCGTENLKEAVYCMNCGNKIKDDETKNIE